MTKSNQLGIALLQVLLITAIISLFALFMVKSASQHVEMAKLSNDNVTAFLKQKNTESQLLLALLTEFKEQDKNSFSLIKQRWNFYGQPFLINGDTEVTIQDQAGLISVQFPDTELLQEIYRQNQLNERAVPVFVDSLLDWQDTDKLSRLNGNETSGGGIGTAPRNGNISLLDEVQHVNGMGENEWTMLKDSLTLYRRNPFNPTTSTPFILNGLLGKARAAEYLVFRENNAVAAADFTRLTGLQESERQIFYPGNTLAIRLVTRIGEAEIEKQMMIEVEPYARLNNKPLDYIEVR